MKSRSYVSFVDRCCACDSDNLVFQADGEFDEPTIYPQDTTSFFGACLDCGRITNYNVTKNQIIRDDGLII